MIKQAGAILFSLLLLNAQAYALVGGPWDNVKNIYGTYSAVLIPDSATNLDDINEGIIDENNDDDNPDNDEELLTEDPAANSLGLVVLVVTPQGFAEGWSVMFVTGLALTGPVVGLGDPGSGKIKGIIDAGIGLVTVIGDETIEYRGTAAGAFNAELTTDNNRALGQVQQRIEGTAYLVVDLTGGDNMIPVNYLIDGYRSSNNTSVDSLVIPDIGDDGEE